VLNEPRRLFAFSAVVGSEGRRVVKNNFTHVPGHWVKPRRLRGLKEGGARTRGACQGARCPRAEGGLGGGGCEPACGERGEGGRCGCVRFLLWRKAGRKEV